MLKTLNLRKNAIKKYNNEILYLFTSYFSLFSSMFNSALGAAYIGPDKLGILNSVLLLIPYLNFLNLGVVNGLNRNLAMYEAMGKFDQVQRFVNASYTASIFSTILSLLFGIFFSIIIIWSRVSYEYLISLILLFANLIFYQFTIHYDTTFRSGQDFKLLSKILFRENIVYFVLSFLQINLELLGRIISNTIRIVLRFVYRKKYVRYSTNGRGNISDILILIKVGFPMMVSNYLFNVYNITDQTIILAKLGTDSLGLYSISTIIISAVYTIPSYLGTILYPKASRQYGSGKSTKNLRNFFWKSLYYNIFVLLSIAAILWFTIDPIIRAFFPKYVMSINSAKINIITILTLVCYGPSIIISVARKNYLLIFLYSFSIALFYIIIFFIPFKLSLEVIAIIRLFINMLNSGTILLIAYNLTRKDIFNE